MFRLLARGPKQHPFALGSPYLPKLLFIGCGHRGPQVPSLPPHLLPSPLLTVWGCGKLMEVLYSRPSKAVRVGTRDYVPTRGHLGIVDEEKLGIGQVQSWQSLIFAAFSQPL